MDVCYNRNPNIDGEVSSMTISGKILPSVPTSLPEEKQIVLKFQLTKVHTYVNNIDVYSNSTILCT